MKSYLIKNWKVYLLLPIFLLLSLFLPWAPGGETWGYWAFSRITLESGLFVISDRSPLYTLYLIPFQFLEYPLSITLEYLITTLIVLISIFIFSKGFVGKKWSILICFLWLPFVQASSPPVQKLALACSLFAMILRQKGNRNNLSLSYTLLFMAYMFRSTYIILLVLFIFWDSYLFYWKNNKLSFLKKLTPRFSDLPLFLVITLFFSFVFLQSPHIWNNAQFTNTIWFPGESGLLNSSFIHSFNILFIAEKYGNEGFLVHDFYLTNQNLFNGAETIWAAIRENPSFVMSHIFQNVPWIINLIIRFTGFLPYTIIDSVLIFILGLCGLVMILLKLKDAGLKVFIIGNILMLATLVLTLPRSRYFFPLIPLFIISSSWLIPQLKLFVSRFEITSRYKKFIFGFSSFLVLTLLSPSVSTSWLGNASSVLSNISKFRVMESSSGINPHLSKIESTFESCKGIMALEHSFLAGYTNLPLDLIVDIWEIPPFGSYQKDQSSYDGLVPERINCLLISDELTTTKGIGSNVKLRYDNYILPYIDILEKMGAKKVQLENFGYTIVLE